MEAILGLLYLIAVGVPGYRILERTGHSGWWIILALIPAVNIVALWVFAYKKWPKEAPTTVV
ncbi:hypothetical protein GCM10023144_31320 [Pigmentiphaga soli]|uniref:DUF805 domain-containing protein n=1 Tax=Pigmentiphaga soli TaxID=1007095 RepID=A0ABP8HAF6_9BURK